MGEDSDFMQEGKGGTELAPMSTTSSLKIAMQYSASEQALLFRLHTKNFMMRGPEISFLSAFPGEQEFLFPPLTYLEPMSETVKPPPWSAFDGQTTAVETTRMCVQTLQVDNATFTIVDVEPST